MDTEADPTVEAVAGASGALLALLTTYPLMTLNTRQHTNLKQKGAGRRSDEGIAGSGTVSELRELMREGGGIRALYRGIEPAIIGTVTSQAVYNFFYSVLRTRYAKRRGENPGALSNLAIASAAGAVNVLLTIPIWTVVTRMQAERNKAEEGAEARSPGKGSRSGLETGRGSNNGFIASTRAVWEDAGLAGFWQGVVPSLVMVSNPALQYMFYESIADRIKAARAAARRGKRWGKGGEAQMAVALTATEVFFTGAMAKLGATVITYPILLVKSRLQAMSKSTDQSMRYAGTVDALRRIVRDEGVGAFYSGMGTKITQTVLAAALMFTAKEEITKAVRLALSST